MSNPVLMVHGFDHDPEDPANSPFSRTGAFTIWAQQLCDVNKLPFPWYSGRAFKDIFKAWWAGHLTTYAWSYQDLSVRAAEEIAGSTGYHGVDVVCHSLGSRVILQALTLQPEMFRRVIFLNGAETVQSALPIIKNNPGTQFLNICVQADDVLSKLAARFEPEWGKHQVIGFRGFGLQSGLKNLIQVQLDNPDTQQLFRSLYGWDLRGDNPDRMSDHLYSYLYSGNWDLYRHFLNTGKV